MRINKLRIWKKIKSAEKWEQQWNNIGTTLEQQEQLWNNREQQAILVN